jgi:hypothetical protein
VEAKMVANLVNASDAFSNIFEVHVEFDGNPVADTFRVEGFTPPAPQLRTMDLNYQGVSFKKILPAIQLDRSFPLIFRVDSNYQVYKKLKTLLNEAMIATGSGAIDTLPSNRATITVKSLAQSNTSNSQSDFDSSSSTIRWVFHNASVTQLQLSRMQYKETTAVQCTATFIYAEYDEYTN